MTNALAELSKAAQGLSRNPLGIIALFIVMVYGFAALVTTFADSLSATEKTPLIYFLVIFPILVLGIFAWLVSTHSTKLFGPGDFKHEENYVELMSATASLTLASVKREDTASAAPDIQSIARSVRDAVPARDIAAAGKRALWVDDNPRSNINERQAFEAVGVQISLALSTDEALSKTERQRFALIISDMARREGPAEAYVLLEKLRERGESTPFLIYTSADSQKLQAEARRRGAQGSTNSAQVLFQTAMRILLG
ncbi:response regulator [Streptomyces cellostaticus]|uniref:response regulator n=1 Tax=Streptomyces cellostaticus TaxID=67285 RepID=UPI002026D2B2|nr:response regulator [Streptomyces cellostaticus]